MIRSMTGYGKITGRIEDREYRIEVRSLNSKQLNLKVQFPQRFQDKEIEARSFISDRIQRGKVDVIVQEMSGSADKLYSINTEVLRSHYKELDELSQEFGDEQSDILGSAMQMPDALNYEIPEAEDHEQEELWKLLDQAVKAFEEFAEKEGGHLRSDLEEQIKKIREGLDRIEADYEDERRQNVKERLQKKVKEVMDPQDIDEKRFEQEMLHYLERMDINEEKTRLKSHLQQFHEVMNEADPGKKLNFITQEIGREINMIGAKADHAPTQREVVNMKDHLERIKEQLMNVR
jgi:uncharacterized protein (TIGR00255 family)